MRDYERRVRELLPMARECVAAGQRAELDALWALPQRMRGFGAVKARQVKAALAREAQLLHRLAPEHYPAPQVPANASASERLRQISVKVTR